MLYLVTASDKNRKKYFTEKLGMCFANGDGVWVLGDIRVHIYVITSI